MPRPKGSKNKTTKEGSAPVAPGKNGAVAPKTKAKRVSNPMDLLQLSRKERLSTCLFVLFANDVINGKQHEDLSAKIRSLKG